PTSTPCRATRCTAPPASASFTAAARCSRKWPPYRGGGDMIASVSFEKTVYNTPPYKSEAGTPNLAGAVGLGTAIDFLAGGGHEALAAHEQDVLAYGVQALSAVPGLQVIGTSRA